MNTMKASKEIINLGKWDEKSLDTLIRGTFRIRDMSKGIARLSGQFIGVSYRESTMIGDADRQEIFVINLEGVDCFTFIDYVEALRLSSSFEEFKENVRKVRYRSGTVAYTQRNHFFTDWIEFNKELVEDVTGIVGGQAAERIQKTLNLKEDGTYFVEGIIPRTREIAFIPSGSVDDEIIAALRTGDYAGIYSEKEGLDVTHVGIIIKEKNKTWLRNASSLDAYRKVVDQDLKEYLAGKPGLIVLRART